MATDAPALRAELPEQVIRPSSGFAGFNLRELWLYRELLLFLAWRNVLIRYKQTALGAGWAILQPLFLMIVFTVFFGRLAGLGSDGIPYPIFYYSALVPWVFFANSVSQGANSLVGNANLLRKIYFPRLAMPISTVLSGLVDFVVAMTLLVAMMAWYGYLPDLIALAIVPGLLLLALVSALGVALWLSAVNVSYRDVQYVVPFLVQLWLFATPIVYPSSLVDEPWRTVLGINPMSGVVEGFRWSLLGEGPSPGPMLAVSAGVAVFLLVTGALYFRRAERTFADVV